ncbi:MAG TPA: hypothetical protein VEX60_07005 [Pyrinomonadaceae bacterium]|nr:hypothetical protein [Pyrinomonadaceae bacterium]
MQPQLRTIIARIEHAEVSQLLESVFTDLNRLLGYLQQVKTAARVGDSADAALFLLGIVRSEAFAAASRMDFQCEGQSLAVELSEELERTGFAIRHELRTVFERILAGVDATDEADETGRRIRDAHDLLHNCFQQSTIALARVFEPELDGSILFDDIRVKRDTSVLLYEDLDALLRSAGHAEKHGDPLSLSLFSERLEHFRSGSMQYLMQKDSETCVSFIEDFRVSRFSGGARFFLRRFSCYLELLLNHVSMRAVLANATPKFAAA